MSEEGNKRKKLVCEGEGGDRRDTRSVTQGSCSSNRYRQWWSLGQRSSVYQSAEQEGRESEERVGAGNLR
jgi:hypothetical protein